MTSTSIYTPFTYCITFLLTGQRYYGSKYANNKKEIAHPSQLWTTYFTSSETINSLIEEHGVDSFTFEIRKIFKTKEETVSWESKFLTKINAAQSPNWLNVSNGNGKFHSTTESVQKMVYTNSQTNSLLTSTELSEKYGKIGEANGNYKGGVGLNGYHYCSICNITIIADSAKCCANCRDRTGVNNPFYGKVHSFETLELLRIANTGRIKTQQEIDSVSGENSGRFQGYYYTPWGIFPSSSQAQKSNIYLSSNTINTWCKYSDKIIMRLGKSTYLQSIGLSIIGKTYREIGFYFVSKD